MINWVLENMKNPDIQNWETVSEKYLAISEKHDKLITSLRTVYAREYRKYSLNKEQTSINDLLDVKLISQGLKYQINNISRI
jgi:hypothetical protein